MLNPGLTHTIEITVDEPRLACSMKSGTLPVFATPAMIALMEETAMESVAPFLEEGTATVGTKLDVQHLSASPLGAVIRCESRLTEVDNRRLVFSVKARDNAGLIGEGTHERFIIAIEKFMAKVDAKKQS